MGQGFEEGSLARKGGRTAFFIVLLVSLAASVERLWSFPQGDMSAPSLSDSLCFAYEYSGDVYLQCKGRTDRMTLLKNVDSFAIAPDGSSFAVIRGNRTLEVASTQLGSRPRAAKLDSNSELYASCGTILRLSQDPSLLIIPRAPSLGGMLGIVHDVLSGQRLTYPPHRVFRCSADRSVLAGTTDPYRSVLMEGYPPQREVARSPDEGFSFDYDLSPDGRFLAYGIASSLCVERQGSRIGCFSELAGPGRISVSNSGTVLFGSYFNRTCHYGPGDRISFDPIPGEIESGECYAIMLWTPPDKKPTVLKLGAGEPQWISPETASKLIAWKKSR